MARHLSSRSLYTGFGCNMLMTRRGLVVDEIWGFAEVCGESMPRLTASANIVSKLVALNSFRNSLDDDQSTWINCLPNPFSRVGGPEKCREKRPRGNAADLPASQYHFWLNQIRAKLQAWSTILLRNFFHTSSLRQISSPVPPIRSWTHLLNQRFKPGIASFSMINGKSRTMRRNQTQKKASQSRVER
jgi:hypothetical protein